MGTRKPVLKALGSTLEDIQTFAGALHAGRENIKAAQRSRLVALRDELAGIVDELQLTPKPRTPKPNPLICKCGGKRIPRTFGGMVLYKENEQRQRIYDTRCNKCGTVKDVTLKGCFPSV